MPYFFVGIEYEFFRVAFYGNFRNVPQTLVGRFWSTFCSFFLVTSKARLEDRGAMHAILAQDCRQKFSGFSSEPFWPYFHRNVLQKTSEECYAASRSFTRLLGFGVWPDLLRFVLTVSDSVLSCIYRYWMSATVSNEIAEPQFQFVFDTKVASQLATLITNRTILLPHISLASKESKRRNMLSSTILYHK